ncbi:MAG: SoxR reducing system RseC family protein [Bacteroidaceae bacterium]|nr:SoxR reducing system RseC family protein [Bacteroidaceae bacterium]
MGNTVRYHGIVKEVSDGHLQVGIMKSSACGGCTIKGHCNSAEAKERMVDVDDPSAYLYHEGQDVWIVGSSSIGWKALGYGIVFPFFVVFISLFVFSAWIKNDLWAALSALGMLIPYYIILYSNREKMKKQLSFAVLPFEENYN